MMTNNYVHASSLDVISLTSNLGFLMGKEAQNGVFAAMHIICARIRSLLVNARWYCLFKMKRYKFDS
jgi:hypothetical protein